MTDDCTNLSRRCPCGECDSALVRGNQLPTIDEAIQSMKEGAERVLAWAAQRNTPIE